MRDVHSVSSVTSQRKTGHFTLLRLMLYYNINTFDIVGEMHRLHAEEPPHSPGMPLLITDGYTSMHACLPTGVSVGCTLVSAQHGRIARVSIEYRHTGERLSRRDGDIITDALP